MFKVLLDLESKVYTLALLRGRIKELLYNKYHLQSKAHGLQISKSSKSALLTESDMEKNQKLDMGLSNFFCIFS